MTAVEFDLKDRLGATEGTVAMTGVHALMRVTADQHRADRARGLRTAGLIAGYRGSPLGGVDDAYEQDRDLLQSHEVQFISGVNEDLGATMIWGSQFAHQQADCRFDGVFGLWYGKGPGIDRSLDALRHANYAGVDPRGGVSQPWATTQHASRRRSRPRRRESSPTSACPPCTPARCKTCSTWGAGAMSCRGHAGRGWASRSTPMSPTSTRRST